MPTYNPSTTCFGGVEKVFMSYTVCGEFNPFQNERCAVGPITLNGIQYDHLGGNCLQPIASHKSATFSATNAVVSITDCATGKTRIVNQSDAQRDDLATVD